MAHEIHQGGSGFTSFIDDKTGNRSLLMAANSRVKTTLMFKLSQTSPGVLVGSGADTRVALPGGAIPVALRYFGLINDAVTSGAVTIGLDNTTSNYFLSSQNVANLPTGQGQQTPTGATNLFLALPPMPEGVLHDIVGHYSVTGTSTSGGPWYFELDYYLPSPA